MKRVEGLLALENCDLAILPGHPSDLASDDYSVPSVISGSNELELRPILDSGYTGVICSVAYADVHILVYVFNIDNFMI